MAGPEDLDNSWTVTLPRVLQAVLVTTGLVASGTGAAVAIAGPRAIPGGAPTAASNDSVMRFYAVWWAAQGPALWRLAQEAEGIVLWLDALQFLPLLT